MAPILIVDDAQEDLVLAQRVLAANRIRNPVQALSSGKACLDYFAGKCTPPPQFPCIVLLDMIMKPTGGLEVLRKLRNVPAAKDSVFIMLSGLSDIKMIAEGYRLGASTFLIKPLAALDLKQMLGAVNGLKLTQSPQGALLSITGHRHASILPEQLGGLNPPLI